MDQNTNNPGNQGNQGGQGMNQNRPGGTRGSNLSDEDRRRGGQTSSQRQTRDQQGQFAGRQSQGGSQPHSSETDEDTDQGQQNRPGLGGSQQNRPGYTGGSQGDSNQGGSSR